MEYYVDKRTGDLKPVSKEDLFFLAPEMFYLFTEDKNNIFTEIWCVDNNKFVNVSYTQYDYDADKVNDLRDSIFEEYNVEPIYLKEYKVPTKIFREVLELEGFKYEEGN